MCAEITQLSDVRFSILTLIRQTYAYPSLNYIDYFSESTNPTNLIWSFKFYFNNSQLDSGAAVSVEPERASSLEETVMCFNAGS